VDDVATMASVINIVAISVNRYWLIAYPISYRKYIRQHLVYLVMATIWLVSFSKIFIFFKKINQIILVNFAPGIWLISLFDENLDKNISNRNDCSGDYNYSFVYMLIAQFNYFIWPFILLCILNLLIMLNIWKRTRKMSRLRSFQLPKRKSLTNNLNLPKISIEDGDCQQTDQCKTSFVEQNSPIIHNKRQFNYLDKRSKSYVFFSFK
jgi:hypothetical protein